MVVDLLRCGVDGSDGWRLCLATNGPFFGVGSFTELIGFDLGKAAAPRTGGRYRWGLPVPMSAKLSGTAFRRLVNFDILVTRFSSVIAGLFAIMT